MAAPATPATPATPEGGSPRLGPAFSPKASASADATPPARRGEPSRATHAECEGVRCPFCDEALPPSLVERIRAEPPAGGAQASEASGDGAEAEAAGAGISADDIRRWAARAGVELEAPSAPAPVRQEDARAEDTRAIPVLPPPPGRPTSASGKRRFGFFSRKPESEDEDDDEEDDDGLVPASGMLGEAPDDDEPYEEKPIVFRKRDPEELKSETPPPPTAPASDVPSSTAGASEPDLRLLLKEVLGRVQTLTVSHAELASSQTGLLTALKIARSNLAMAEANTEMLEADLRRAKASAASVLATPAAAPARTRPSLEGTQRPSDTPSSGGKFGFWGARKSSPAPSPNPPTPSSSAANAEDADEVARLRTQVASQANQLDTLRQGKKAIEAELEGLSQALFEEANKMVADERRRRAELEETLREARDEREALRATIKVLGGSAPGTEVNSDDDTEGSSAAGDLTAHYAALRAGIDRVGAKTPAGPSPLANDAGRGVDGEGRAESDGDREGEGERGGEGSGRTTPDANANANPNGDGREDSPEAEMPGGFGKASPPSPGHRGSAAMHMPPAPVPLETEANPWG